MITCKELVDFLHDYVSGELSADERAAFEEHLAVCPPCIRYLESYKAVIRLAKAVATDRDAPAPADVPEDLVRAILSARKKGSQS
jgi:anti-sigma factor RsiW